MERFAPTSSFRAICVKIPGNPTQACCITAYVLAANTVTESIMSSSHIEGRAYESTVLWLSIDEPRSVRPEAI